MPKPGNRGNKRPKLQLRDGSEHQVTTNELEFAQLRHMMKYGKVVNSTRGGLVLEPAKSQGHVAEYLMTGQIQEIKAEIAREAGISIDQPIVVMGTRNESGGQYSDKALGAQMGDYTITP